MRTREVAAECLSEPHGPVLPSLQVHTLAGAPGPPLTPSSPFTSRCKTNKLKSTLTTHIDDGDLARREVAERIDRAVETVERQARGDGVARLLLELEEVAKHDSQSWL